MNYLLTSPKLLFSAHPLFSIKQPGTNFNGFIITAACFCRYCFRKTDGDMPTARLKSPLNELILSKPTEKQTSDTGLSAFSKSFARSIRTKIKY